MGLSFSLYYNTALRVPQALSNTFWTNSLSYSLTDTQCFVDKWGDLICHSETYQRPDGSTIVFSGAPQGGPYTENGGGGLATLTYDSGSMTYTLHDEDATTKVFDSIGQLKSITDRSGVSWTISHSGGTYTVTHSSGKSFTVAYGATVNNITPVTVTDPAGNVYSLQADGNINYQSITYPGSPATTVSFKYASSASPYFLTEVDYNGTPYSYTTYDTTSTDPFYKRATSTYLADNSENNSISYAKDAAGNLQATVTNPLGHRRVMTYDGTNGTGGAYNGQLSQVNEDAVTTCGATVKSQSYDANGNVAQTVDNNGNVHMYTYASTGQLQTETEASGTSLARKTDYVWDTNNLQLNRLLSVTVEGVRHTSYTYNAQNRLASVAVTNLSGTGNTNLTLTTTYNYSLYANGMVQTMTVTNPSPNNSNVDTYQYDTAGNLTSVTDGLGHSTTYSNYDGLGEAGRVTGPNGDATDFSWDARGRLASKTTYVNGTAATWSYGYDGFGLKSSETAPDGESTTVARNSVMRVTSVTHNDKDGSSTETLGYDANGDLTSDVIARGSDVGQSRTFTYDGLGRIYQARGANGQVLTYAYDGDGNVVSVSDALGHATTYQYDALNRRTLTKDPAGDQTQMAFDAGDHLVRVTDPRGLVTSYAYDGFDHLWSQTSPDSGTTSFSYDAYGRAASKTFASGLQWTFGYDGINRVTQVATAANTHVYAYDNCANGIGRLCSASDSNGAGSVTYTYLPQGMVTNRTLNVGGTVYSLSYGYDRQGRLATLSYPDGNQATYSYTQGVVSGVSMQIGANAVTMASGISYRPFDLALSGWTANNGLTNSLSYDADVRSTGISVPGVQSLSFSYDSGNRLTQVTNGINGALTQSFGYDSASRLTSISSSVDSETFAYDAAGNRVSQTVNGGIISYSPSGTSNQMASYATGGNTIQYGYDAQGNQISQSNTSNLANLTATYQYGYFNKLASATKNGVTTSYYNDPEGYRLEKSGAATGTVYFAIDSDGTLLAENNGGIWKDYLWLNGRLLGLTQNGQAYAVHDDQLGRPEAMTDSSRNVVWRAQNLAFTRNVITSTGPTLDIGLPGQYYDIETGLWNNLNRYYDSALGRYVESDPIGLQGGDNTYGYVGNSPTNTSDPLGLCAKCYPNVGNFVSSHLKDAQTIANSLGNGVTAAEVLAVAGNETHYGQGFASFGNFFGVHGTGPAGTYYTSQNYTPVAKFPLENGFLMSGQAFIGLVGPYMQPNMGTNPLQFFTIANQHGYATGNSGYPAYMVSAGKNNGPYTLVLACMSGAQ